MKNIEFAQLTLEQKLKLNDLTIDRISITYDEMAYISNFLELDGKTVSELRAIRNAVVKHYNSESERHLDCNFKIGLQIMANLSGVAATIDNKIFELGGAV